MPFCSRICQDSHPYIYERRSLCLCQGQQYTGSALCYPCKRNIAELMSKSGKMSAAFTTVAANYYYDTRLYYFSYLQAGSAPASRSSLTAAFCPAAEATCSKVNLDKSTGLLRRVTGLGTSERSLSGRSWPSDVSTGSWRSLRRVSTSPTLQAVNRASLRPYSHDSSTIPKKNHRKLNKSRGRCIFRWLQVSRGTGAI